MNLFFLVAVYYIPESPNYLMSRGQEKEAEKVLNLLDIGQVHDMFSRIFRIQIYNYFYLILSSICFNFLKCSKLRKNHFFWPIRKFFFSTEKYCSRNPLFRILKIRQNNIMSSIIDLSVLATISCEQKNAKIANETLLDQIRKAANLKPLVTGMILMAFFQGMNGLKILYKIF